MDVHKDLGLLIPGAVTDADRQRAAEAIANAPVGESGLVLPPHVAAEREAERQAAKFRPNRAERRWRARQERLKAKRDARMLAGHTPEQQAVLQDVIDAAGKLTADQTEEAIKFLESIRHLPREEQAEAIRLFGEGL